MNNPLALVLLFFGIVVVWCTFVLTVIIFMKGARVGEADLAHRDDSERTTSG